MTRKTPLGHILEAELRVLTLAMRLKRDPSQRAAFIRACRHLKAVRAKDLGPRH